MMEHKNKLKMLMMKKGRKIDGSEKDAAMSVLEELMGSASAAMADKVKSAKDMKKVSVMSDSKEGLKEGLDKAEDVIGQMPDGSQDMETEGSEDSEEAGENEMPGEEESSEMLEQKIKELEQKLQMKRNK